MRLSDFLQKSTTAKVINLFCDLETYQFNEEEGYKNPSKFKNQVFSLAVAYIYDDQVYYDDSFFDFHGFFDVIEYYVQHKCKIKLYFHNGNGYDNHYMLYQLLNEYDLKHRQMYVKQVDPDTTAIKPAKLTKNMVLEKRVKASTNLELMFRLNNSKLTYVTIDTLPKTGGRSLRALGLTMNKLGLIDDDLLKSDFEYQKYNLSFDLSYKASKDYACKIHSKLTPQQKHYIRNDVLLLANVYKNFTKIYPGFDFNKITFSQNVLKEYEVSPMAKFQLTGRIDYKTGIKYSDYDFCGENLFDYMKHYYKGGLNFYNDEKIGKIIKRDITSLDINSSYPNVMYNSKIPYQLIAFSEKVAELDLDLNDYNHYYLFEVSVDQFNSMVEDIPSRLIRKLMVKYYSNLYKNMYINTNTIRLFNLFNKHKITHITVFSYMKFKCRYFAARDVLAENYAKKTQGKNKNIVDAADPNNIKIFDKPNKKVLSKEEIAISKVILNGIYGLPALRAYYNYFRYDYINDQLVSVPKGFKNTERNQLFSIFVTSQAIYNLLEPLYTLSPKEIDQYLYYGDTDSLYIDDAVINKVDKKFINDYNLGAFKKEHHIKKMYLLNHKKYAFELPDGQIIVHAGGVPLESFDLSVGFEEFVKNQFSAGSKIKSIRNYRTESGTIAIYDAIIKLDKGGPYPKKINKLMTRIAKTVMTQMIKESDDNTANDKPLYIESPIGAFSIDELIIKNHNKTKRNIKYLITQEKIILKGLDK